MKTHQPKFYRKYMIHEICWNGDVRSVDLTSAGTVTFAFRSVLICITGLADFCCVFCSAGTLVGTPIWCEDVGNASHQSFRTCHTSHYRSSSRNIIIYPWLEIPWWRHQMETFSASLAICAGNSPVPGELPAQRPVTRSFDVFFDLRLN